MSYSIRVSNNKNDIMNNFLSKVLGLIAFTLLVSPCLISQNNVKLEPISCEVSDKVKNSVIKVSHIPLNGV